MRQIALLVEGQTEEALVKELLAPAAQVRDVFLRPMIVTTSATPHGTHRGGGHWRHYDRKLRALLRAGHWHRVALIIDYYQYPKGAPGRDDAGTCHEQHQHAICRALRTEYADARFRPLVMLHEIEALVLAAVDAGWGEGIIPDQALASLRRAIAQAGGPEKVNNGPSTSPSKRLERSDPTYMKTVTGPLLICDAGLPAILERCPTFAAWWAELLS